MAALKFEERLIGTLVIMSLVNCNPKGLSATLQMVPINLNHDFMTPFFLYHGSSG